MGGDGTTVADDNDATVLDSTDDRADGMLLAVPLLVAGVGDG